MINYKGLIPENLKQDIYRFFSEIKNDSIVIHTDLLKIGAITGKGSKTDTLNELLEIIIDASGGRTIYFPTFNYEFCVTGIYDVKKSICQVGALNEFARNSPKFVRTHTPLFNFAIINNKESCLDPVENVFGEKSTFHEFVKQNSAICFLGTNFTANTFMYHCEEMVDIGYRYKKIFIGKIVDENGIEEPFYVSYRVRPRVKGIFTTSDQFIDYDYSRHEIDTEHAGLLYRRKVGKGEAIWYEADKLFDFWSEEMRKNELYLLTEKSQQKIKELYEIYGKPLTYEKVELNANI